MAYLDVSGSSSQQGLNSGGNRTGASYAPVTGINPTFVMIGALVALFLILRKGR